jgi:predicted Ser/Thr protein kinase
MSTDSFEAPSLEVLAALLPAYDFESFIAQGGMGAVYKARQRSLDRDVAIKILPRELGEDPEFRQSFEIEAKAMARLNHPNLIGVYDYGDVDGMPYIVMEYVNGKSLFHSAYQMAVDPMQAVSIVKGICDGLAHAHENGVIHRDIKPANILLNDKVVPKIGDFGLARPVDGGAGGPVMGTPGYVAPEVLHSPDHADRRSDLFALGVVLYELLIGRCPPYDYQPPASVVCGCDVTLDRICDKAMHRVAELRYQSAEEMSADLDAWLRRANAPAGAHAVAGPVKRPGGVRRVGAAAGGYRPAKAENSSGAVKGVLMLAAAVTVAVIGWSKFNSGQKTKAAAFQAAAATTTPDVPPKSGTAKPKVDKKEKPAASTTKRGAPADESPSESLGRLRESLAAGKRDEMPVGSVKHGDTQVMVVTRPLTWKAAAAFATMHGAHLFIAKSSGDIRKLTSLVPASEDGAEAGVWIGAGRTGADEWTWVDGANWELNDTPQGEGVFVIVDASGGLQMRERVDQYPFVIQWRKDGATAGELPENLLRAAEGLAMSPAKGAEGDDDSTALEDKDLPAEVAKLDATAKTYLEKIGNERDKELAQNAKAFIWGIESWHKDLSKNDQAKWNRDVTLLKGMLKGGRVPENVDPAGEARLSAKMAEISKHCAEKQKTIDSGHDSKADKARASYATRMAAQEKLLTDGGDAKGARAAAARAKKAGELRAWTSFIRGEKEAAEEEMVQAASSEAEAGGGLAGRWVWLSKEVILIRADGSLYNETKKQKGSWKLLDAGRYEMSWNKGEWIDKVALSYTGNELGGSNQNGDRITGWRILEGEDPLIGPWKWGPAICIFRPDNSALKGDDKGTWSKGEDRAYTVRWESGWVDYITLSADGDEFKGTNSESLKVEGKRVEED